MNRLAVILALVVCAAAYAQGFRIRRSDDEAAVAVAADAAAETKVDEASDEADLKTRFGPLAADYSSFTSSKTVSSVVANEGYGYGGYGDFYGGYPGAGYGAYGYGAAAAYDPAFGYDGYGAYGAIPNVNFQSIGPNGRPAVSYESPNFGFYFRSKDAVKEV